MTSNNLPLQLTNFIGREHDLASVERILSRARLITLTGVGGCGKTRLAIEMANRIHESFPDGVWLVALATLHDPDHVPHLVAETLGLRLSPNQPLLEALQDFVHSRQLLLLLDNCEHLITICARLAQQLLAYAPRIKILVTSREPLGLSGETTYPVSGLDRPDFRRVNPPSQLKLDELMKYDAIHLFVERARTLVPDFTLTSENAFAIAKICQHLDGLPLALELASARTNVLTVQEIAARLDDRFSFLTSGHRTGLEPRHQTLRATIDWSYELLTTEEQILFKRMAVFAAGCTLDTAQVVCTGAGIAEGRTLDVLSSLVDKSLVVAETLTHPQARYRLLETIREYALEKLNEAGETPQLRDRHLSLFVSRAEETAPKLTGPYQQLWFSWLETEHDNLRAALAWALESGCIEAGLRLVTALYQFLALRNYWQEGLVWFERLLEQADERVPLAVHVYACTYAAFLAEWRGNSQLAVMFGRRGVELAEAAGEENKPILGFALGGLASAMRIAGDYEAMFAIQEQFIELFRELGESYSYELGMGVLVQGQAALWFGMLDKAHTLLDEALKLARESSDPYRIALALNYLGDLARLEREYALAHTFYEESAGMLRDLGAERDLAGTLHNLGHACLHLGDSELAHSLFDESVGIQQAQQNRDGIEECLIGFAALAVARGLPDSGTRLLAAVIANGWKPEAREWPATRMEYEQTLALTRSQLTESAFLAEQAAGRALSLEQAVKFAQQLPVSSGPVSVTITKLGDLTDREREVATLVAQGQSNGEIAEALVLSKRTVEKHIANILSKLTFTNRAQIVRWVIDNGIR